MLSRGYTVSMWTYITFVAIDLDEFYGLSARFGIGDLVFSYILLYIPLDQALRSKCLGSNICRCIHLNIQVRRRNKAVEEACKYHSLSTMSITPPPTSKQK